jgi:hypothetical protein
MKQRTGYREIKLSIGENPIRDLEGVSVQVIRDHSGSGEIDGFDGQFAVRVLDAPAPSSFDLLVPLLGTEQIVTLTIGKQELTAIALLSEGYALKAQGDACPSQLMAPMAVFGLGLVPVPPEKTS